MTAMLPKSNDWAKEDKHFKEAEHIKKTGINNPDCSGHYITPPVNKPDGGGQVQWKIYWFLRKQICQ